MTANHCCAEHMLNGTCYRLDGQGAVVALIHGVGLDLNMWAAQAEALKRHFKVLRYDLHGHGNSARSAKPPALTDFVEQFNTLLSSLGVRRCAVIGFSLGALIARGFVRDHADKVSRLVIMNGVYQRNMQQCDSVQARLAEVEHSGPGTIINAALERWFADEYRQRQPDTVEAIRRRLESNDADGFLDAYRVFADGDPCLGEDLSQLGVPALIMTGEQDVGSTPAMAQQMAMTAAEAKLCILARQRHMMPMTASSAVNQTLLEFLGGGAKR